MNRCAVAVVVASLVSACRLDTSGTADTTELIADSVADDTSISSTDTGVGEDTTVDSTELDTLEPDTFVADTVAPDTFEAAVDAGPPPFCDATDTTLVACYRFEGNGKDESSFKNDLSVKGASYVTGVDGTALSMAPTATVTAPDTASFAVTTQLTIEMWVRPRSLPTTGRMGLIDDDGRFGLFIYSPGTVRAMSPAQLDTPVLPLGAWSHVAFTYDGATMRLYLNGVVVANAAVAGTFGTGSGSGVAVGMNSPSGDVLDGEIDSLRVFRVARSTLQICRAAGKC